MNDPTSHEVARTLFGPSAELEQRIGMLTAVVVDLMVEVEALRGALIGVAGYREAYKQTGLLSHDSTGPSMGLEKVIDRFYPRDGDAGGRVWRESLMLRRLGFSADDVAAYREEAKGMETRT